MNKLVFKRKYLCQLMSVAFVMSPSVHAEEAVDAATLPEINIHDAAIIDDLTSEQTGEYKITSTRASTQLNLDVKDTPQSVSVVTRQQMDDFGLDTLNDVLNFTPSVNVEQTETDRTYYTSRGFTITNFQVDSLAIPTAFDYPIVFGDVDTAIYDRVEVLRGANGLLSGTGNPAATVNYVRKRPTTEFQASAKGLVGSWSRYRGELDISGSLNEAETVRGRFVAAYEDKDSHLDRYSKKRQTIYGVVDFQLSDNTLLTLGHSYQMDDPDGVLWGSLPLIYSDGSSINYDTSSSNSQDWTYWTNQTNNSFIELKSDFDNGWQTTAQLTRVATKSRSKLFYIYGNPASDDSADLYAYTGEYNNDAINYIADMYASGPIQIAGREHEVVFGGQWAKADKDNFGVNGPFGVTSLNQILAGNYSEPSFGSYVDFGSIEATQRSLYSAARLNFTDKLNLIVGTRYVDYDADDTSYGKDESRSANEFVPYIGTVYALTDRLNAYASYTEIFQPQSKVDVNNKTLDPAEGETFEVGLKVDLNQRQALASISLFKTEQNNVAEAAGINSNAQTYYVAKDGVSSKGIELELSGKVAQGLQLLAGYTYLKVEDNEGERTKLYIPKQSIKLASTYQFANAPKWKVGANMRWQTAVEDPSVDLKQGAYSVWGALASYQINSNLKTTLNLYNIFDKEYFTSFYGGYGQAYMAAPRSAVLSMDYDF